MATAFYTAEKCPVILQLGKCFTKVGFGSEPQPRAIIHTPELQSEQISGLSTTTLPGSQWDIIFASLLRRVYFQYLQVVPSERRVIFLENDLMPTVMRDSLSRTLFEKLRAPSIVYLSEMITPLYTCGMSSGLVVDIGFQETRVMPVCFGVPLRSAYQTTTVGSQTINQTLRHLLVESMKSGSTEDISRLQALPDERLEDMKTRCCYVRFALPLKDSGQTGTTSDGEDELLKEPENAGMFVFESKESLSYQISDKSFIVIPANIRWQPAECLFAPPIQHEVLPNGIIETIIMAVEACTIDAKRHIIENLLLCGGGAEMKGLLHRITAELGEALANHPTLAPLADKLTIGRPEFSPLLLQWIGAAAASAAMESVEAVPDEIFLNQWEAGASMPDWTTPPEMRVVEADSTEAFLAAATEQPTPIPAE